MGWARVGQASAELGALGPLRQMGSSSNPDLPTASNVQAYTGAYSYYFGGTSDGVGWSFPTLRSGKLRAGCWLNFATPGVNQTGAIFTALLGGNDRFVQVQMSDAGAVTAGLWDFDNIDTPDDTKYETVSAAGAGLSAGAWHHVGLAIGDAPGINAWLKFYVDGALALAVYGLAIDVEIDNFYFGGDQPLNLYGGWGNGAYFDDVYVDVDTVGDGPLGPPPARRFYLLRPTAAGSLTQWTPVGAATNFDAIDDTAPDGDATYVFATALGKRDLYPVAAAPALPIGHTISAVCVTAVARKADPAMTAALRLVAAHGQTALSDDKALTAAYANVTHRFVTDPAGQPWTPEEVDACEFGYETAGDFSVPV